MSNSALDLSGLSAAVIKLAVERKLTIVTAESCTGGGIGQSLTSAPGASGVFLGGIISYANSVKEHQLNVPQQVLITHGAVSELTARLMAENVRSLLDADLAISATGIAGPGGGTSEKPVGLVYLGLSEKDRPTEVQEIRYGDIGREAIRTETIHTALEMLRARILQA